jgi:anti-sigma regulatory factor (Ser/Thr protein kinase)
MASEPRYEQTFYVKGRDFANAGEVSAKIKSVLREIGLDREVIRRAVIAAYEAEMNIVMYADEGRMLLTVTPEVIRIVVEDSGQGIEDVEKAMQEGYSTATPEMREMGFGAGMGLPNIRKNSDFFELTSKPGVGCRLLVEVFTGGADSEVRS